MVVDKSLSKSDALNVGLGTHEVGIKKKKGFSCFLGIKNDDAYICSDLLGRKH
jgi:hypothetical protein